MQHATTAYGTHEMFHKQWSSPIKDGCLPLRLRPHWPPWSLKEELSLFLPRGFNSSCSPVWKVPSLFYATAASSLAFGLWSNITSSEHLSAEDDARHGQRGAATRPGACVGLGLLPQWAQAGDAARSQEQQHGSQTPEATLTSVSCQADTRMWYIHAMECGLATKKEGKADIRHNANEPYTS